MPSPPVRQPKETYEYCKVPNKSSNGAPGLAPIVGGVFRHSYVCDGDREDFLDPM